MDGSITVDGLLAPLTIRRDRYGIAHIRSENEHDAWFGQAYAAAQDRLWQMEYDRRRATGRWAEIVGGAALPGDVLARRMQLERAARLDVDAMSAETRSMFDAYAAGVNAFLQSGQPLPVEYQLTQTTPEPWQAWHSVATFKIRHILMGSWQLKLAHACLLARIGPERYAQVDSRAPVGSAVILPPGRDLAELFVQSGEEIAAAAKTLGFLADAEGGSNSWVVHGDRTSTGMPVLCNDSHRELDVPNVYWQVQVTCPDFNVIGATFPGLPGFPHFGHNERVAWCITHTMGDYQDLYIEQFDVDQPHRYRTATGWDEAERRSETIHVRDGDDVEVELWRTAHGPIVHGDPRRGRALSLRYTATDEPCRGFDVLRPMLRASSVPDLFETQRLWVDPVNNLLAADTDGNAGYLMRGRVPIRSTTAARQFPAPGWTGEHEWVGSIPFDEQPRSINPEEGFIATANQPVLESDEPYIAHDFHIPARAERLRQVLGGSDKLSVEKITALQGDTTSLPAQAWARLCRRVGPFHGDAETARSMLAEWDGNLLPDSAAALLYAHFRRTAAKELFEPVVGADAWAWLVSGEQPSTFRIVGGWLYAVTSSLDESDATPDGRSWETTLPAALAAAYETTAALAGPDPKRWRWADVHSTNARHTLAALAADRDGVLNPPRAAVGGDGDTIQAAGYAPAIGAPFDIGVLSVYRQVVDLAAIEDATWIVPGGVSGLPATPHYADQLESWRQHQRIPMTFSESALKADTIQALTLLPPS